ncbi:hypothetical protein [Actinophytocola sp.]|uniref:hypothetical protein n=1 Tax=Actinophytocola sp. TaxID=1872138 RepID=UPI002D80FD12|nr:hypothetical protein [Actinophytocola sp.]HET9142958.1 hypothetical protein [Actinophytocola sp.]
MHAFDILGDPARRRILELLADGEQTYAVEPAPLSEVGAWLDRFRRLWEQRLDALGTEMRTKPIHQRRDMT